jgi:dienelactone hydrolase
MGALDDWTPASQCQALIAGVKQQREWVEAHVYAGAHHSFDALGLPVRYLDGVGNRSKPGGCCGAHYGANETAWKAFVADVRGFLARQFADQPKSQ